MHLTCCYGGLEGLYSVWEDAEQQCKTNGGDIKNFFNVASATEAHLDLHRWMKFVINTNQPLKCVEDGEYRDFSKAKTCFGKSRFAQNILEVEELVREKIKVEMAEAGLGAIMHDGWTCGGVHYVGLFACYMHKVKEYKNGNMVKVKMEPECVLIACSPMDKIDATGEKDTDHMTTEERQEYDKTTAVFNSQVHVEHFRKVFKKYFDIELSKWCKCSIADNTATNRKIAKILNVPHVGCNNHKYNLDIEDWVRSDELFKETLSSVALTMKEAKGSINNVAVLSEITDLKPILYNKTRWSGKYHTLVERFLRLRDAFIEASNDADADFHIDTTQRFKENVERILKPLERMNFVTVNMQHRCILLARCHKFLDKVIEKVEDRNLNSDDKFYNCTFVPKRIRLDGPLSPDLNFESGVVKIQNKMFDELSDVEKDAVRSLLAETNNHQAEVEGDAGGDDDSIDSFVRISQSDVTNENNTNRYVNCDFIFGSCAEVERLWSIAKFILTDERRGRMTPGMFEALLFLKINKRFWGLEDVVKADGKCKKMAD